MGVSESSRRKSIWSSSSNNSKQDIVNNSFNLNDNSSIQQADDKILNMTTTTEIETTPVSSMDEVAMTTTDGVGKKVMKKKTNPRTVTAVSTTKKMPTTGMKKTKMPITPPGSHPSYNEMVCNAISNLKEKNGSSRQAIMKFVMTKYSVGTDSKNVASHIKVALRKMSTDGKIKQAKGTGASGSFKMGEMVKKTETMKKSMEKPKAAIAKKSKVVTIKTPTKKTTTTGAKRMKKIKVTGTPQKPKAKIATKMPKPAVAKPKKSLMKKMAKKPTMGTTAEVMPTTPNSKTTTKAIVSTKSPAGKRIMPKKSSMKMATKK